MKKTVVATLIFATLMACSNAKPGKELLTINGKVITEGDLDFLGTINPRIKMQLANPMGKKQLLDNIIEQELFYQAAVDKGLDKDPSVKEKADLYKRVIIAQAFVEKQLEDDSKEYYDSNKPEFERLRLSHILVKTKGAKPTPAGPGPKAVEGHSDAEALALATKIKERLDSKKEDFATVAKEVSEDPITKNNGGDLGDAAKTEQRLVRRGYEPLLEKAFALQVGEVSGPIKTEDGYHLIVVTRGVEVEPFDEAKQGIVFKMQGEIRNRLLTELKQKAKINYSDPSLSPQEAPKTGEAPPAPPAPGEPPAAAPQPPPSPPPPAKK